MQQYWWCHSAVAALRYKWKGRWIETSAQPERARSSGTAKRVLIRYSTRSRGKKRMGQISLGIVAIGSHRCDYTAAYIIEKRRQYELSVVERRI